MSRSRKELLARIASVKQTLTYQQTDVIKHKAYLDSVINDHRWVVLTSLLPAFLWGWERGKKQKLAQVIKQFIKYYIFKIVAPQYSSFSLLKQKFFPKIGLQSKA